MTITSIYLNLYNNHKAVIPQHGIEIIYNEADAKVIKDGQIVHEAASWFGIRDYLLENHYAEEEEG